MDKGQFAIQNGNIVSYGNVDIPVHNRSFRYGDGLFETMRAVDGKIPFWDFHMQRLERGIDILNMDSGSVQLSKLKEQAIELLKENEHQEGARVRLTVYRDGEGNYFPQKHAIGYTMESVKMAEKEFKINSKGKNMDVFMRVKKPVNLLSMIKTANAQLFILAANFAQQQNMDDVFIVNQNNELCEAVSSNVFVIRNNQIFTPPLSSGCLPGTMRMVLMSILAKRGIQVAETKMTPNDLIMADEIFLCNAVAGIQWVGGYKSKRFYKKYSDLLVKELNKVFLNS